MTPTEAVRLTGYIQAHFPSQPINEFTPDALAELLTDAPPQDCHAAVLTLAKRGEKWCAPADVAAEVQRVRNKRIADVGDLCPPPNLTVAEEHEWLRIERRRIADGGAPSPDPRVLEYRDEVKLPELPSPPPATKVERDPNHAANLERARAELDTIRGVDHTGPCLPPAEGARESGRDGAGEVAA